MTFLIEPLVGVGDIRFGMPQDQVRYVMRAPYETFMKASWSKMPTDSFFDDAIHIFYRDTGTCEAVEFFQPSRVLLDAMDLLGVPYSDARQYMLLRDSQLEEDEYGFTSTTLGVGAYAPRHREMPHRIAESIIVFDKDYYKRHGI